jgi:hypothetical protein
VEMGNHDRFSTRVRLSNTGKKDTHGGAPG